MARRDPKPADSEATSPAPLPLPALLVAFVLSGAAGLIYESVWSRYLGLFVGHGAYAQVIVLVIFMGGMAAGALAVARISERIADPLRLYAWVEAAAGVLGLLFHPAFVALTELAYRSIFPAFGESFALQAVKWGIAGLLILPQSVLLGATFPLMAAGVARRRRKEPGRVVALLYFANSLGAAAGVLLAGFWLVSIGGLRGTLAAAAILNLVVAGGVLWIARRGAAAPIGEGEVPDAAPSSLAPGPTEMPRRIPGEIARRTPGEIAAKPAGGPAPVARGDHAAPPAAWLPPLLIGVSFGTAVASFVYEIAWVRMLSLVLGSATHSFELMLSAFILGLALGALWLHRRADRFTRPLEVLAAAQWAMGALALGTLPLYAWSFQWMAAIVNGLEHAPRGYEMFSLARYAICLAVMLPATFCAGITLPLITRILMRSGGERAIGAVYGANTIGSILGAALAGLALLPWLGLERLLAAGAALDIGLGVLLLALPRPERNVRQVAFAALGGLLVIVMVMVTVRLDPLRLVSGVYVTGRVPAKSESQVLYYHHGRTATVSVRVSGGLQTLSTNGKADASIDMTRLTADSSQRRAPLTGDESTQFLAGMVSLAYAAQAKSAAVIGMGSGMTSHVLLGSPRLEKLVTIEIEPDMIEGARLFLPANQRVFEDRRSKFVIDDARSYFAASRERFDLIVSEPSNPWVSGVSGLFTDEFYRRVKSSLTEDGVLAQWIHLYSLDDDLVLTVLAALHRNFRDFHVRMVSRSDCMVLATDREGGLVPDWNVILEPGLQADLARTPPLAPRRLDATWVGDRATFAPLLERTRPNSDFMPLLDLGAERARFRKAFAIGMLRLHADRHSVAAIRAAAVPLPDMGDELFAPIPRFADLAQNAHFRSALAKKPAVVDSEEAKRLFAAVERFERVMAPGRADPQEWLTNAVLSEEDFHRGSIGSPDPVFFARTRDIAERGRAPRPVHLVLDWLWSLESRDYRRAAVLTDSLLIIPPRQGKPWLDPALFLDGGATAKLAVGDTLGARRVALAAGMGADPGPDLRARLIHAAITRK
ncbi:MAG TPA: fused MFS/spermidine synthase [Candidatus Eisenbacteria bacterium]|nr:fused MFS/spermidine synthase [Candidatus Eisenbacteria bacterium]